MNIPFFSYQRPVLSAITLLLLSGLTASPTLAETRYITPSLEVPMRQTQNNRSKLITLLPIGVPVELMQGGKEWSRIRLQNATEGWVRSRFLSSSSLLPGSSKKEGTEPESSFMGIQTRFKELTGENDHLKKELAVCTIDRNTLADKYQALADDPTSALHAKTALNEAQEQVKALQNNLAAAQIENTVLQKNESIKWFLVGSGVLFIGWLIGRLSGNGRKKKSSLLN